MTDPTLPVSMTVASQAPTAGYHDYLAVVVVAGLAIAVVFGILTAVWLVSRRLAGITSPATKTGTYECGEEPVGPAWSRFNLRFYLIAIIFLIFDIEISLVLPTLPRFAAYIHAGEGFLVFAKIFLFIGTLLVGLWYAAAKGDFRWDKAVNRSRSTP
jgi:NADH-quinone oxidoreductase subunit A